MSKCFLLLVACFNFLLSDLQAQTRLGPAYFLRHPVQEPRAGLVLLPGGPLPALPVVAAIPTRRAVAVYAPRLAVEQLSQSSPTGESAPRRDLTGVWAYPPYDPYWNLPETYRKHTLPDVWAEPLPLQLLRSALGR